MSRVGLLLMRCIRGYQYMYWKVTSASTSRIDYGQGLKNKFYPTSYIPQKISFGLFPP